MKNCVLFILITTCVACSSKSEKHEGFTYNEKGFYYKLHSFNEGYSKAQIMDYVTAVVQFSSVDNDSIKITEKFDVQILKTDSINLSSILHEVREGDSITYIVPNTVSIRNLLPLEFTDLFKDYSEIRLVVKVISVVNQATYVQHQKEMEIWLKSKRDFEMEFLKNYISKSKNAFTLTDKGIYKFVIKEGRGDVSTNGELISISYQGSLLSGEIINHFTSLEFKLGQQWQVIDGIERAIRTMKLGERALIIVPSEFAWGEQGTSDKSIAPFTTVLFDIELLSVKKP